MYPGVPRAARRQDMANMAKDSRGYWACFCVMFLLLGLRSRSS